MEIEFRADAFAGRRVVVTGGTSGIGAAVAPGFAEVGARVTAAGLRSAGDAEPDEVAASGRGSRARRDGRLGNRGVFQLAGAARCARELRRRHPSSDEYEMDVFRRVLEVNLVGTMRWCVAARPLLAASHGCIVNVASMTSFFASPHAPAYGASKAAIVQLTKSLAASFAPHVRVNAVAPGGSGRT